MMGVIWATKQYWVWLVAISLACMLLETIWPWRRKQKHLRRQFGQDLLWLVLNGHYVGIAVAFVANYLLRELFPVLGRAEDVELLASVPLWVQFVVFLVFKDFLEWCIHNLLHRVPALWTFHKLHHSIEELDWIGNFRFHWMEVVIYKSLTYFPLIVLGVDGSVILAIAIVTTIIGDLNHSNIDISWGPLRYVINSPRMHVWHHMYALPEDHRKGVNFGVVLSVWDWLLGTAYWPDRDTAPEQQPARLGFPDMDEYPRSFIGRFLYPLRFRRKK
ncbi:MAG: sterol desaturase family protein [Planctomycetota bacterium]|jgi:sterol desaturase/sphingolipid hydroxylase (fatty acid hydroxylase superfamily)